jgi:hypothetical protein
MRPGRRERGAATVTRRGAEGSGGEIVVDRRPVERR